MVSLATKVKFLTLESELEALLTEAELIRTYQPDFNILLKDDKSPLYINITDEKFPRVLITRKKEIIKSKPSGTILGPFSSAHKTQEVLKIARKIFGWCNKSETSNSSLKKNNGGKHGAITNPKPCFYYHIELCPGSCVGEVSKEKYNENIKQLVLFLRGKKQTVAKNLKNKMTKMVELEKFEEAAAIRDQLEMIEFVTKKTHRLKPELTTQALKNKVSEDGIIYLQKIFSEFLGLPKQLPLHRIEGYDVSNTQGTDSAVSMVVFIDGKPDTSHYRIFNIKTLNTPNDYQMMREATYRRQNHPEWGTPNLIVIDGGKGQVRSVLKSWKWNCPVIGIAKNPDRLVLPKIKWGEWELENKNVQLKNLDYHIVKLEPSHPSLKLIQQIRDESHRFSQNQHKRRRLKGMFE
jgi:excinuclease ABC subunit C